MYSLLPAFMDEPIPITICIVGDANSVHILRWCKYLKENGYSVHIIDFIGDALTFHKNKKIIPQSYAKLKIPLYAIPGFTILGNIFQKSPFIKIIAEMERGFIYCNLLYIIRKIKPDIIHAHYLTDYGYWATKTNFHPLVLSAWGSDVAIVNSETYKKSLLQIFKKADLVHTGDIVGEKRLNELGCDSKKIFIQPFGIDVKRFIPSARSNKLRNEILNNKSGHIITLVRSLKEVYDIPTFIKASSIVIKKRKNVKLLVIGDGIERDNLETLSNELGVQCNLTFMGAIPNDELHPYLASSDIYVDTAHPTKGGGGIGVALMEAMSSGLPCVIASRPGGKAFMEEWKSGLCYEGDNHEELAEKLLFLIDNDEQRKIFGEKSREVALAIGDWEKNMNIFENKYKELIDKNLK